MRDGLTDVFDVACGVCVMSGWVAGGLSLGMAGAS